MKKRTKRLALNRETLRRLEEKEMEPIHGGVAETTSQCACSNSGCSLKCDDRCDTGNPYTW